MTPTAATTPYLRTAECAARLGQSVAGFRKWARRRGIIALAHGRYYDWRDIDASFHSDKVGRRVA